MFQSPSVRVYNSENVDMTQRKPGNASARKPFVDRSVNSKTPDTKLQIPKLKFNKVPSTVEKPKVWPKLSPKFTEDSKLKEEDLNAEEFICSFKDIEDFDDDIWPQTNFLTENLVKIMNNYCHLVEDTPPPSPERALVEIDPMFFELPKLEPPVFQHYEEFLNESFNVDLPNFDETELNNSL